MIDGVAVLERYPVKINSFRWSVRAERKEKKKEKRKKRKAVIQSSRKGRCSVEPI